MTVQTKVTEKIKREADKIKGEGIEFIINLLIYLKENYELSKKSVYEKKVREADKMVDQKILTGCTDYAHLFIAFCKAKKIPVKYIETLDKDWIKKPDFKKIEGHIFVKVKIKEKVYLIDPTKGSINVTNNYGNYVPIKRGEDFGSMYKSKSGFIEYVKMFLKNNNP